MCIRDSIKGEVISAKLKKATGNTLAIDWHTVRQTAEEYRQNLRIKSPSIDNLISSLSGGNMQKVVLAKWMYTDPKVLILDEPTRGIDVGAKFEIYTLIGKLAAAGIGVIVISSELPELLGITDRIYTIFEGKVTGVFDTKDADQESLMRLMNPTTSKSGSAAA